MSLVFLPTEILHLIIANFSSGKDTNALARVCRQLYVRLNSTLYEAEILHDGGHAVFLYAAQTGRAEPVQRILQVHAHSTAGRGMKLQPNRPDSILGLTPLAWAAIKGQDAVGKVLLQIEEIDVNLRDRNERTPLSFAAENGRTEIVRLLLAAGADPNIEDKTCRTALDWAGSPRLTPKLSGIFGWPTDIKDAGYCSVEVYYDYDIPHTQQQLDETHALSSYPFWAAGQAYEDIASLLLDHGADIERIGAYFHTPLIWAAMCGYHPMVEFLLRKGAAHSFPNTRRSALSFAAEYGRAEIVQLLIDHGSPGQEPRTDEHKSPLAFAASNGHEDAVRLLLIHTTEREEYRECSSWTPLEEAAENGHEGTLSLLLDAHAEKWPEIPLGPNPLFRAVYAGNLPIIQMLIAAGAELTAKSKLFHHMSLLHVAVMEDRIDVAKFLLDTGLIDINELDDQGHTALDWATRHEDEEDDGEDGVVENPMKKLLLDSGANASLGNRTFSRRRNPFCQAFYDFASEDDEISHFPISFH